MIFSRITAGVDQSIRRNTRNPRLNQVENRLAKSASTIVRSFRRASVSRSWPRISTSVLVAWGARLSRRSSSSRRGSVTA
jgi:hypothetical protein